MSIGNIDLTQEELQIVKDLLKRHIKNTLVWAYGSRVKHTSTKYSDLDMVVFATKGQSHTVSDLRDSFEDSRLPFKVDLFVWDSVPEEFKENIKSNHIVLQKGMNKIEQMLEEHSAERND